MDDILKNIVTPGYDDFKCYDFIKSLLMNEEFYNVICDGISKGYITFFDTNIWDKIENNYNIDFLSFFKNGMNIGSCFSFANMLSYSNPRFYFCQGYNKFLTGSKNSTNGEHSWLELDGYIYDTSLMIKVSNLFSDRLGYDTILRKDVESFVNYDVERGSLYKGVSKHI